MNVKARAAGIQVARHLRAHPILALLVLATGLAGAAAGCGRGRAVVAKIGDRAVTREEFDEDFARRTVPAGADVDSLRLSMLESMIHKELLVLEAKRRGYFDPNPEIDAKVKAHGDRLLLERVRADEVKVDTTVTDADVFKAFETSKREVHMRHFLHWSKSAIDSARQRIDAGESFEKVAMEMSLDPQTSAQGGLLNWLNMAQFTIREFREIIDTLAVGRVAGPFPTPFGWHMAMVEERRERQGADMDVERERIEQGILDQRARDQVRKFADDYWQRYRFEIDDQAVTAAIAEAELDVQAAASDTALVDASLGEIWIPADSTQVLGRYKGGTVTVADLRRELNLRPLTPIPVRLSRLNVLGTLREVFYNRARLLEASRHGYDRDRDWKRQVELKREELVVEKLYQEQIQTALQSTEAEERAYYDAHPDQFQTTERFRYAFIRVDDGSVAEGVAEKLPGLRAAGFDTLVSDLRKSGHLILSARDTGFIEASSCGAIPEAARSMKPGDVGHVVEADGMHTVFSLIHHQPPFTAPFEQIREKVKVTVANAKSEELLVQFLKELEDRFEVKRYPGRLVSSA
jgi:parvulin-like peptidyl-prolyl isomerase